MNSFHTFIRKLLVLGAAAASASACALADGTTISTGVDTNNNLSTVQVGSSTDTVDTNWRFTGYYDSYDLTRGQVFGSNVSNPNGAIGYNISSAASSAATTGPVNAATYVDSGAGRPGWYNPGNGAQWISDSPTQQNGGIPINPPGNYEYQMNLSQFVNPNGGAVTITIAGINADNHFELAIGNSAQAQAYLAEPFANQETWNTAGDALTFTFSPADGTTLDVIVANNNDQLSNGNYVYEKNPTGFMIDGMKVSQASGATPPKDKMVSVSSIDNAVAPNSGPRSLVAAPEPATWAIMGSFASMALARIRRRRVAIA